MCYFGVPFREHEERRAASLMNDFEKEMFEALSFAFLAVGAGIDTLIGDIHNCVPPNPDLLVRMKDGASVFVEVGRIRSSEHVRHFGEIEALNKGLALAASADEDLMRHVSGHHISFTMESVPEKVKRFLVVAELVATIRAMNFEDLPDVACLQPHPTIAPTLSRLNVTIAVCKTSATYVAVSSGSRIGLPCSAVADFERELRRKARQTYSADAPIWLAMPLDDPQQSPSQFLAAVRVAVPTDLGSSPASSSERWMMRSASIGQDDYMQPAWQQGLGSAIAATVDFSRQPTTRFIAPAVIPARRLSVG
jgi:hypothetical protein